MPGRQPDGARPDRTGQGRLLQLPFTSESERSRFRLQHISQVKGQLTGGQAVKHPDRVIAQTAPFRSFLHEPLIVDAEDGPVLYFASRETNRPREQIAWAVFFFHLVTREETRWKHHRLRGRRCPSTTSRCITKFAEKASRSSCCTEGPGWAPTGS